MVSINALFKTNLSSKDIALIGVFGALSTLPLLLTNIFNLVAITHIPGTNGVYVQFIVAMILWVGIGLVGKHGSATVISGVSSVVAVIIPGGPPVFLKPLLIPFSISSGFIIDLALLKSKSSGFSNVIAGFFGILRGLQTLVVQTFLGLPIAVSLIVVSADCASGAIGANVGIHILRQLYHSGMSISSRHII